VKNNLLQQIYRSPPISGPVVHNVNNEAFISLTAHFIRSDDMQREIYVLSAKHFPGSHTGVNIGQILNDVMEEWHISSSQIHLILRDNASNMIVGTGMYF